jgi:hypothetical protein
VIVALMGMPITVLMPVVAERVRIPVKWAADSGDVGQGRSEATLVVFLP